MSCIRARHDSYITTLLVIAVSFAGTIASVAKGQVQYGAPVPPLVPATDPMIQGPPVTNGQPTYGQPVYGQPVYGQPVQPMYGAPVSPAEVPSFWQSGGQAPPQVIMQQPAGQVIGGELIQGMDGAGQIVESIAAPPGSELVEDVPPFNPVWYNPMSWIGPYWDGSVELGLNGSSGSADALSIRTGFDLSRETERTNWDIDLTYNKNQADGVETLHNTLFYSNWDFKMRNPKWTWFTKLGVEYDEFKDFDVRVSLNTGLGYLLIDTDLTQFRPRFGAGASREFGGVDEEWHPEAVFGFDFSRQISSRQQFNATVDYYPRWDDFADYRVVSDVNWELVLDEVNNLSLKVGVIDRYDSTPNGAEANDLNYSVLLLWSL